MFAWRTKLFCVAFGFAVGYLYSSSSRVLVYNLPKLRSKSSVIAARPSSYIVENNQDRNTRDIWFSTFLLIIVPIRPSDSDSRQLIRDTWFKGFKSSQDVALRFIAGTKQMDSAQRVELTKENETFGDIIFVDIKEDYAALTNKTLALINWAHHHVKFSYLMKCDDDTYVFVERMIVELRKRPTTTKLYYGNINVNVQPIHGNEKWADNKWSLGNMYLPYALGGGYILSHDLVAILSEDSPHLMWHLNEDTAIGAWVSAFDHEQRSDGKFCFWYYGINELSDCKDPVVALLCYGHSDDDLKKHFHYFHGQANANTNISVHESCEQLK